MMNDGVREISALISSLITFVTRRNKIPDPITILLQPRDILAHLMDHAAAVGQFVGFQVQIDCVLHH